MSDRATRIVAAAAAALSAAINIRHAVEYPFWQDEVGAARVITTDGPIEMLRAVAATEFHPPGFYGLGWVLSSIGVPAVWDRAISVLAAMALSGLLVLYARRFVPLWGAALVGLVPVFGWQFWRHGWELRPYALFALVCLVFVVTLERAVERPTRGRLALVAGAVAVGVMTHYFFVFTLAAGVLWVLLVRRATRPVLIAIGVGLIPLVAWAPALYKQYNGSGLEWIGPFRVRRVVDAYTAVLDRSPPSGTFGFFVSALVLVLVLAGVVELWRRSDAARLCALCGVVPVAVAAIAWLIGPEIFLPRNLIGAAPFAAIAISAALAALPRPLSYLATAGAAVLLVGAYADTRGRVVPAYDRVAAALVQEGWREQDPILLFGPPNQFLHTLDWYLPGNERLEFATWQNGPCDRVFVVAVGGRARALVAGLPTRRVKRVVIARSPYRESFVDEVRNRHGRVFATRAVKCARVD